MFTPDPEPSVAVPLIDNEVDEVQVPALGDVTLKVGGVESRRTSRFMVVVLPATSVAVIV